MIRAVIDTNVVFNGLTQGGTASYFVIKAWETKLFQPCLSDTMAYEYLDVFPRKLSQHRWKITEPKLAKLIESAFWTSIAFRWRPASPDPGDDHVIDCALNANALLVTLNVKDFRLAQRRHSLLVLTPQQFMNHLVS